MNFSITKNGKPLSKGLYNWDEETKTFSSKVDNLVLDFSDIDCVTFKTGHNCTFDTGSGCTFDTRDNCTFNTEYDCTFNTGSYCTFNTESNCTFDTGSDCTFDTGHNCIFEVKENCVLVRRDVFEIHQLYSDVKYILNDYKIKGFKNEDEIKMQLMENLL